MSDLNRLADLLLPGIRNAQLKLEEVSNYLSAMPNSLRHYGGWQLIETAPKDGKLFLGTKNLGVGYGWTQYICRYCDVNKSFGALFSLAEGGIWYPLNEKNTPSHWMPLPEPPK